MKAIEESEENHHVLVVSQRLPHQMNQANQTNQTDQEDHARPKALLIVAIVPSKPALLTVTRFGCCYSGGRACVRICSDFVRELLDHDLGACAFLFDLELPIGQVLV